MCVGGASAPGATHTRALGRATPRWVCVCVCDAPASAATRKRERERGGGEERERERETRRSSPRSVSQLPPSPTAVSRHDAVPPPPRPPPLPLGGLAGRGPRAERLFPADRQLYQPLHAVPAAAAAEEAGGLQHRVPPEHLQAASASADCLAASAVCLSAPTAGLASRCPVPASSEACRADQLCCEAAVLAASALSLEAGKGEPPVEREVLPALLEAGCQLAHLVTGQAVDPALGQPLPVCVSQGF